MLVAAVTAPSTVELVESPDPVATPGWSVVDVSVAPLCTEFTSYRDGVGGDALGHEAVGTVSETAPGSRFAVGDRVVAMPLLGCGSCALCRGGDYIHCPAGIPSEEPLGTLRERIRKPDWLLIAVPDGLSDEHASLACCALGASFGAFERARVSGTDVVLITGLGAVGLGAVANAVMRGCRVVAVETNPYRKDLALRLGAEEVYSPDDDVVAAVRDATGGIGADVAVECSGAPGAQRTALGAVRRLGTVAFVGNSYGDTPLRVSPDLIFPGLTIFGSWHYNLRAAGRLLDQIARHPGLVSQLITHRYPLADIGSAWQQQIGGHCGKVLIRP